MADTDDVFVLYESKEDRSLDCICVGVEKKGKDPLSGRRTRKSRKLPPASQSADDSGAILVDIDELEENNTCIRPSCSGRSSHFTGRTVATDSQPGNTAHCSVGPTSPVIVSDSTPVSSNCVGERSGTLVSDSTPVSSSCIGEKRGNLFSKGAENTTNSSCVTTSFTLTKASQGGNDQLPLNDGFGDAEDADEDSGMEVDEPAPKRRNISTKWYHNILDDRDIPSSLAGKDSTLQDYNDEEMALPLPRDGFVDADYQLALELSKQLNYSASKQPQLASNSPDAELARQLQEEEYSQRRTSTSSCQLAMDEELARKLQEEEEVQFVKAIKGRSPKKAHRRLNSHAAVNEDSPVQIVKATKVEISPPSPSSQSFGASSSKTSSGTATEGVQLLVPSAGPSLSSANTVPFSSTLESDGVASGAAVESLHHFPSTWTKCPNCRPDAVRKYHLVDVSPETEEWSHVASPLTSAGFLVKRVQRIQNSSLWQRMQYEKRLLVQDRPAGFDLNEKLLFHTSRAQKAIICEEGLDQRLSRNGNFGTGIYFRFVLQFACFIDH